MVEGLIEVFHRCNNSSVFEAGQISLIVLNKYKIEVSGAVRNWSCGRTLPALNIVEVGALPLAQGADAGKRGQSSLDRVHLDRSWPRRHDVPKRVESACPRYNGKKEGGDEPEGDEDPAQ